MNSIVQVIFSALCLAGVISWIVSAKHFLVVRSELRRARQAGELSDPAVAHRGIPLSVILTDVLPAVAAERRKLVRAMVFFIAFCAAAAAVMAIFGPHP
jgi:succinate dehydrogenase hydrophobic anchor subunit